jgi:hypothetical protein
MMNGDNRDHALRIAVGDWQRRHGLSNHDPLLGVVELFEVFLGSLRREAGSRSEKVLDELCETVDVLSQRVKSLSKQIDELVNWRRVPQEPDSKGWLALTLGGVVFGAGVAVGRSWG